jgi:hypothetical protein
MENIFTQLTKRMSWFPGVSEEELNKLCSALSFPLPSDYIDFLKFSNGANGFIGDNFLQIWRAEDLRPLNEGYSVKLDTQSLFLFGSDGGGEGYGFDYRKKDLAVVMVPFIPLEWEYAIKKGNGFLDFLQQLSAN